MNSRWSQQASTLGNRPTTRQDRVRDPAPSETADGANSNQQHPEQMKNDDRTLSCGHYPSPHSEHTTGTAHTPDGREICWECADKQQREALKDRTKPAGGYLSSDGRTVTTWTGGHLGTVTSTTTIRLARWSAFHGKTMQAIRVRDIHGGMWHGRTSPGMSVNLRPLKG